MVLFDPNLCHKAEKDKKKYLLQCNDAWNKKIEGELIKYGIRKEGNGTYVKPKRNSGPTQLDNNWEEEETEK